METVLTFFATFFNILCKTHIHLFKNKVQFSVLEFNAIGSHDVWTVSSFFGRLNVVETLQNLDLPLIKGLLFGLKFVLELFDGDYFARFDMSASIHMSERAASN